MKKPIRAGRVIRAQARELRRSMTPAEVQLWNGLRGWKIDGFRRQHPIDRFILDFYSPAARLCVEVDGGVHASPDQHDRDEARSEALAARGIRVIRFTNDEVLSDPRAVLRAIKDAVSAPTPAPSPLPFMGEGGASQRAG